MFQLPPTTQHKPISLAVAALSCLPCLTIAAEFNYTGPVNEAGNPLQGISGGTYETVNIHLSGIDGTLGGDTTEGAVIKGSNLTVTKSIVIVNTVQDAKIDNNGALYATGGATVDLTGPDLDLVYLAALPGQEHRNKSTAISAKDTFFAEKATTNVVKVAATTVQLIGSLDVMPSWESIFDENSSYKIEVSLDGENSFWYGSAINENGEKWAVDVTLSNGATWIYSAESNSLTGDDRSLGYLTLNGGVVLLADDQIWNTYENTVIKGTDYILADYRDPNAHYTGVELGSLTGSGGIFVMDLDWQTNQGRTYRANDGTSDFIEIGTVENGSHQFVSFDQSKAHLDEMNVGDKLYFASVVEGTTTFSTNADGEHNSAAEVYAFDFSTQSEVLSEADGDKTYWFLTKSLGRANENTSLLKSAALASYSLASDLDRLNERRGQSRYADRGSDGVWVRYRYASVGMDEAFDMDKHMIQVGYDKDVSNTDSWKIVGVAFDYTRGDTDLDGISASGDNDRYGLNLYYTVLADCGGYADFNAKIGRIGSDYDARNSAGQDIGASFWQTYYGLSAEVGYKYDFTKSLFVEPQAQLQVMRIEGDNFSTNGGVNAAIEDTNSVIGRLGFRAGYQFSFSESLPDSSVYVVADVLREFKGDTAFQAIGRTTAYDYEQNGHETWFDAGLGADISVSQNTKLWLDTKYVFGGEFENTWALNAGVRWEFN